MTTLLSLAFTFIFLNDAPSPDFNSLQSEDYKKNGCSEVYEKIFNEKISTQLASESNLKITNYFFCGVKDLDPGAWAITRDISVCVDVVDQSGNEFSGEVWFKTQGDLFCDNEGLLNQQSIILNIY